MENNRQKEPNLRQQQQLQIVQGIIKERRHKDAEATREIFRRHGYTPLWRRVKWCGGVGTYRMMRSGKIRVQIIASVMGYNTLGKVRYSTGKVSIKREPKGFRYAWCVEL